MIKTTANNVDRISNVFIDLKNFVNIEAWVMLSKSIIPKQVTYIL